MRHLLGEKVRIGKYKKRTGYKRHNGHRSRLSQIEIQNIGATKAPAKARRAAKVEEPAAEAVVEAVAAPVDEPKPKAAPRPRAAKPEAESAAEAPAEKKPRAPRKPKAAAEPEAAAETNPETEATDGA